MRKKVILGSCILLAAFLMCSCTLLSGNRMESMFRGNQGTDLSVKTGDTVTIPREEYEKYQSFSELVELLGAADTNCGASTSVISI